MSLQTQPQHWGKKYEIITGEDYRPEANCYACSICNKCIAKKNIFKINDQMYCWYCFGEAFSQKCVLCKKLIIGSNEMTFIYYDNKIWHTECFPQTRTTF